HRSSDHIPFNQFIDDDVLIDLPLSGRKFIWYKGGPAEGFIRPLPSGSGGQRGKLGAVALSDVEMLERYLGLPTIYEKFKMIKLALKEWHEAHAHNLPRRIEGLKVRFSALEGKGEEEVLSEAEIEDLHGITFDIHSLSRRSASICWQ
ncbi:endonuclease/exonuclease/phosphatase family protein, partial [Trifolium medium]|nr:endonuclease/exonuclease/phosphatase family protein [Trifolium medium]